MSDLAHNTRRMLQALDAYWLWYDGWNGPANRLPRSQSTEEDWWHKFEKYRARVEAELATLERYDLAVESAAQERKA